MNKMKLYSMIDQWGTIRMARAKSARQAAIEAWGYGGTPSVNKIYCDRTDGKPADHVGYEIGQGRGYDTAWVNVYECKEGKDERR